MLSDEEKKELQELINLLYNGHISQYGKRKLEAYIKKQQTEIEELRKPKYIINFKTNEITKLTNDFVSKDKIKAKIEEVDYKMIAHQDVREAVKQALQSLLEKE